MRQCTSCGILDREIPSGLAAEPEHFVKPEIRYIKGPEECGEREKRYGWQYRMFQGRPAMERMTCIDCLRRNAERDGVWGEMRKQALELEAGTSESGEQAYFKALCES